MWLEIQIFGFRALWSPYFMLFVIGLGILYFLITGPYRHRFTDNDKPTIKQQLSFYSGLVLLYIVKGSPIDLLSHIMLTAHMIQMALLYFVFPIAIIKGTPAWIWKKVVYAPVIRPIFKVLTKPVFSVLLFSALLSVYHVPVIFDFSKSSQFVHSSITIFILFAAFLLWWPILTPLKEFDTLMPLLKMAYLVVSAAIITLACALIIFAGQPLFKAYSAEGTWIQSMSLCVPSNVLDGLAPTISGPEMFSPLSTIHDQQLGGVIMKIIQEIVYGIVLGRIYFSWSSRNKQTIDPLPNEITQDN